MSYADRCGGDLVPTTVIICSTEELDALTERSTTKAIYVQTAKGMQWIASSQIRYSGGKVKVPRWMYNRWVPNTKTIQKDEVVVVNTTTGHAFATDELDIQNQLDTHNDYLASNEYADEADLLFMKHYEVEIL
ncbi:hypothetical protein NVP1031O_030 [Vibrio phage 1.031.O._10N.261.46.F8]|nr:hypothetical protein NVP1031O_030 [Vibrio phage 1.031.O._10N.261.46.F8]